MQNNIIIPTSIYQEIAYSSYQLNQFGQYFYNVPITLILNEDGSLQQPINLTVQILNIDGVTYENLVNGVNYTVSPIPAGITLTLLQTFENAETIIIQRSTTINANVDFETTINGIKPTLNEVINNNIIPAVQDNQASIYIIKNKIQGLATLEYVNSEFALTEKIANKGVANGYCPLDSEGVVPFSYLPQGLAGGLLFKDTWDAALNIPFVTAGVGTGGEYYQVNVAGAQTAPSGILTNYNIGDIIIYNGFDWKRIPNTTLVFSVNTYTGDVVLISDDIAEGILNLYYTTARVEADTAPLIAAAVSGLNTQLNNKVDKDIITSFGNFGAADYSLSIITNQQGLVLNIAQQPIGIASSQVLDLATTISAAIANKADKIIPTSNGNIATLNVNDGNLLDSGVTISTDVLLFNSSNLRLPTENAIKTYIDTNCEKVFYKGVPNGYASLDGTGVVVASQLPPLLYSLLVLQGEWDALNNITSAGNPIVSSVGINSYAWIVSVSGSTNIDGINIWNVGDVIYFDGTNSVYRKRPGGGAGGAGVVSLNGFTGVVTITSDAIPQGVDPDRAYASPATLIAFMATQTTTNLAEGVNKYYESSRVFADIQTITAAATTVKQGTVKMATGSTTNIVPDNALIVATYAPLNSPTFTGAPTASTPALNDNSNKIATTGFVKQNLLLYPIVGVSKTLDQINASNVYFKVIFQSVEINEGNAFNATTNQFKPSRNGWYKCSFNLSISPTGNTPYGAVGELRKNGIPIVSDSHSYCANSDEIVQGTKLVYFNGSTDFVEIWALRTITSLATTSVRAGSFFQAEFFRD